MKATYQTHPRKLIMDFFEENPERQFTIEEIINSVNVGEEHLAQSSAYRIVSKLVTEGVLRKNASEDGQLRYGIFKNECHEHLHLKCTQCGKVLHADHEVMENAKQFMDATGFDLDFDKTLLVGKCPECRKIEK